jgi:hypothetical protein
MAYSDFTIDRALKSFGLELIDHEDLFENAPKAEESDFLRTTLDENVPLALAIHTEKARSELIVMPILVEVRRLLKRKISLFSGISFDVDFDEGLNGICDFILAQSPTQILLRSPAVTIVEAKNDNMKSGLGQCIAAMVAARRFNEREGEGPTIIYGAVTTGSLWRFLRLDGAVVHIDRTELFLDQIDKILTALIHCVGGNPIRSEALAAS